MISVDEFIQLYLEMARLADAMLLAAQKENWTDLLELDAKRAGLFEKIQAEDNLLDGMSDEPAQTIKRTILHILEVDKQTMALSLGWMRELTSIFASVEQERRLLNTYK